MFSWIFYCCTPGARKIDDGRNRPFEPAGAQGTHYGSLSRVGTARGTRSLTTNDMPDVMPSAREHHSSASSAGPVSRAGEPLWRPELKLLTYNIFIRPELPLSSTTEYQEDRLGMFVDHVLPNYDIVCLQEMFHVPLTSRRKILIEEAKSIGYFWHHHSNKNSYLSPTIDGGLLVLSKLPIIKTDFLNFESAAFADWYATKGVLYCLIQCGHSQGHFVHVFCTHLQATYTDETKKVSEKVRAEQLEQMTVFIEKCVRSNHNGAGWPIAICGDVNVQCRASAQDGTDSSEYVAMMKTLRNGLGPRGEFLRDLAKEIDGITHPVTYGEAHADHRGRILTREKSLSDQDHLTKNFQNTNQSLDKMFWIPSIERDPIIRPTTTVVNPMLIDRETWQIRGKHALSHLSDHYAIETTLAIDGLRAVSSTG
jgi:endonuclease/exonuclease/phosphatase family metal-dependent hydrolase